MKVTIKRATPILLAGLAGVVAILPAIILGIPKNNDLAIHYHYAIPFYEALGHGQLYPGWLATLNSGYGDDIVRFYPPALYYLLAVGRAITGNWYTGSLLVVTCLSGLGSVGAYFWARSFVPANVAVWAGLFYALMPYHLSEFYQAAQLAEFFAGAALLFALAFTKRVCDQGRWRDVAGLAAAYAALVLSHLPLAVFGSLTLSLYALMSIRKNRLGVSLAKLAAGVAMGLAASSFYWVTMVAELKWIMGDGASPDPLVNYSRNFVFSTFSPEKQETIWWMGLLAIATILMSIPALGAFARNVKHKRELICVSLLLLFSLAMSTAVSKPLWAVVPYLEKTQHPFRWLAVTSTAAPILMAASVPFWSAQLRQRKRSLALLMTGLVLIAITFSISQTVRGATYLSRTTFEQMLMPLKEVGGTIQWLPIWASASAGNRASYDKCVPPTQTARVEASGRAIRISEWGDLKRRFEVEPGTPVDARVSTFYYPHWIATANGRVLPTRADASGALLISLPAQHVAVNLEFREPARAKLSGVVSIISWTLLASFLIFGAFVSQHEPIEARREQSN